MTPLVKGSPSVQPALERDRVEGEIGRVITRDLDRELERPSRPLPLSPALREQQAQLLRRRIGAHLKGDLRVVITDNRAVMISVQRDPRHARYVVRLHHLFVDASDEVLASLARYIVSNDRVASRELNDFIDARQDAIKPERGAPRAPRVGVLRTEGRCHDLAAIFGELNRTYFEGRLACRITWGRHVGRGRERRSIKVGSFSLEENLIRIHPGLDQEWIPAVYVRWVLFHEMLHAASPAPVVNGRHAFHTPEFAAGERRFREYLEATDWERRNLAALLCI